MKTRITYSQLLEQNKLVFKGQLFFLTFIRYNPIDLLVIVRGIPEKIMIREKLSLSELGHQDGGTFCLGVSPKCHPSPLLQSDRHLFRLWLNCSATLSMLNLSLYQFMYQHLYSDTSKLVPEFLFGSLPAQPTPYSFKPFTSGNVRSIRRRYQQHSYPVITVNLLAEFSSHINPAIRRRN